MALMSTIPRAGVALCLVAAIVGCEAQRTVSLEQAESITAEFVGRTVETPPRSADDLIELVSSYDRPSDAVDIERIRRKAEAEPTPAIEASPSRHAAFLNKRSVARQDIGDIPGSLADAREALRLFDRSESQPNAGEFLFNVAWSELLGGDFGKAIEIAERGLRRAEWPPMHLSQLGRFSAWRGELEEAKRYYRRVDELLQGSSKRMHTYLGRELIARAEGRWEDAEQASRVLISRVPSWYPGEEWVPTRVSDFVVNLSRSLVEQGRLREAELVLRQRLLEDMQRLGTSRATIVARVLQELSIVYLRAGRPDDALLIAHLSCDIGDRLKLGWGTVGAGRVRCVTVQAEAHLAQRRFTAARALFDEVKTEFGRVNPLGYASWIRNDPDRLLTEVLTGAEEGTAAVIDDLLARLTASLGSKHYRTAETKALKAAYLARTGHPAAALPLFREAFSIMTRRSRQSGDADRSLVRQRFIYLAEIYLDALAETLAPGGSAPLLDEALRVAAQARAQRVAAAVSAGVSRAAIGDPDLAELARREQDAQRQIEALYGLVAQAALHGGSRAAISGLREQIDSLRTARAVIVEDIEARFPDYAVLTNPKTPGYQEIQRALGPDEALISFYFTERRGLVFVVPSSGPVTLVDTPLTRNALAEHVRHLRAALEPDAATVGGIPAFDVDAAWALYRDLLHPARPVLDDATRLIVVNHAFMGQLPLAVLPIAKPDAAAGDEFLFAEYRKVPWLARRWSTAVVPSEASFIASRSAAASSRTRRELVAFGDPAFSAGQSESIEEASAVPHETRSLRLRRRSTPATFDLRRAGLPDLPPLPDTREEVEAIAMVLGADLAEDVFVGRSATESRVKRSDFSDRRIVVFATHGLVPGDLDGLNQPALALSAPRFDRSGEDGLLTLSEILSLRLDADLVVLSACNTGSGDGAGAEAISGLARGFLYAGARSILASGWPVETSSARMLTTTLFERQKNDRSAWRDALQSASLNLVDEGVYRLADGRAAFSYAHPLFWAPFFVVGDSGK